MNCRYHLFCKNRKAIGCSVLFFFLNSGSLLLYSQITTPERTHGAVIQSPSVIHFDDVFKQPYRQSRLADVKGSPFYSDSWRLADITFSDGNTFKGLNVKLNIHTHELIYLSPGNIEIILKDGVVRRMIFYDSTETGTAVTRLFVSGLPLADKDTSYPFFEILAEGKANLLKMTKKKITVTKDALMPVNEKEFVNSEILFLFMKGELKKCESDCRFYSRFFDDKKESIENFISANNLKCRKQEDMLKLIRYYNSL